MTGHFTINLIKEIPKSTLYKVEADCFTEYVAPTGDAGYTIEELTSYVDYIKKQGHENISIFAGDEYFTKSGVSGEIIFHVW